MTRLDEIRQRLAGATEGYWFRIKAGHIAGDSVYDLASHSGNLLAFTLNQGDSDFIAHTPQDVAYLLTQIDKLRDRLQDFADYDPEEHAHLD